MARIGDIAALPLSGNPGAGPAPDAGESGRAPPPLPGPLRYPRGRPEAKEISPRRAGGVPPGLSAE